MNFKKRTAPSRAISAAVAITLLASSSLPAELLVYEPFDYPDGLLTGQGGALGTTGVWASFDSGNNPAGWWCHPEGEVTGQGDDRHPSGSTELNLFDGLVDNLPTAGGFVGAAGPEDKQTPGTFGTRSPTGNMDANIGLDPSVTATFTAGTTTWFSYVGAHADNRNQGSPTFMLCTDPTVDGARGLTMQNAGNGIGGTGGPTRFNLQDVYPHYFSGGVHHQTPGGYEGGVFGGHNGIVTAFCSTSTCNGVLDESGVPRTQTMAWAIRDADGFMGVPNIVIGKIEWDADTGGEDVVTVVRFLEDEELSETAFNALVTATPPLSSRNWPGNKPDLDQSEFDTINISSLKFWVDEIRVGTTFADVVSGPPEIPLQLKITTAGADLSLEWESESGMLYNLRSVVDPSSAAPVDWPIFDGNMDLVATPPTNSVSFAFPADAERYFVVEEFPAPPPPPLFEEDFDSVIGPGLPVDWSTAAGGTAWQVGDPTGGAFSGPTAANSAPNCAGTVIDADYLPSSTYSLITPVIAIPAGGATLRYEQFIDTDEQGDVGTIQVLDADNADALLEVLDPPGNIEGISAGWTGESIPLPVSANGKNIKIEFLLTTNDNTFEFAGFYIDDVVVEQN